jgi:hypothetical protein
MIVISCDPGIEGAFVHWVKGSPEAYSFMPLNGSEVSVAGLKDVFRHASVLVLEKVGGLMGQSPSRAFNFGRQVGTIYATAITCGLQVVEVAPQKWQSVSHYGLPKTMEPKARTRAAAERLYPKFNTVPVRCRVSHDGVCDALLIGHWYKMHKGEMDI